MIILEIIATILLGIGLIMIATGTAGILGFRLFIQLKDRKSALGFFLLGFLCLYISGVINTSVNPIASNNLYPEDEENRIVQSPNSNPSTTSNTTTTTLSSVSNLNSNLKNQVSEQLQQLNIIDNFGSIPDYDRDFYFGSWEDFDGDCQNTRAEVLINESFSSISFRSNNECVVDSGEWYDPYTAEVYYFASDLDVDHFVPLYNAWYSGAYQWEDYKRVEFANYLNYENHLIAVDKSANRQKGKDAPNEWMPPNTNFHCEYISIWVEIKYLWELTVTTAEYNFLSNTLSNC